jgi:uncharacterized protein YndB with AHSA1/START domain
VFDAWLDPEVVGAWMFGHATPDEEVVRMSVDPRVGGSFSFLIRRNGKEIDHVGKYLEIDRPRRLVFTWAVRENLPDTSRVILEISPAPGGADLTLTHELDPKWADYAERTEEGWTKILTALARVR